MESDIEQLETEQLDTEQSAGSQLLSKVLSPAVRLWLRAQIESAASLEFQISGRNRQLLQGQIPAVRVSAAAVIYQGLHLSQVQLEASQIQINLAQVMQGKALRLLKAVPVVGEVCLTQADLTASAESQLLQQALADLLKILLPSFDSAQLAGLELAGLSLQDMTLRYPNLLLGQNQITLTTELVSSAPDSSNRWHLTLQTALHLARPASLQLSDLTLEIAKLRHPATSQSLPPVEIDLGREVNLRQLEITPNQIICAGQVNVIPA